METVGAGVSETLSDLIDPAPFPLLQDLRRKAARLVAAKCTLAARVDSFHESTEGKVRGGRVSVHVGLWSVWRRAVIGDPPHRSPALTDSPVSVSGSQRSQLPSPLLYQCPVAAALANYHTPSVLKQPEFVILVL